MMNGKGLLDGLDDLLVKARESEREPVTPQQYREQSEAFDAWMDHAVDAVQAQQRHDDEKELDQIARQTLERAYSEFLMRRAKKAPRTKTQYLAAFKNFKEYCDAGDARALPARAGIVGLYLHHEIIKGASAEKIRLIVAAISHYHNLTGEADPTVDELVKAVAYSTTLSSRKKHLNGSAPQSEPAEIGN